MKLQETRSWGSPGAISLSPPVAGGWGSLAMWLPALTWAVGAQPSNERRVLLLADVKPSNVLKEGREDVLSFGISELLRC